MWPRPFRNSWCYNERMRIRLHHQLLAFLLLLLCASLTTATDSREDYRCQPTVEDEMGPFYRPEAPVRSAIGQGYILSGQVLAATDCRPIGMARIEVWQAGPSGRYDAGHRATLFSERRGDYRLETDLPPPYVSRPPHIHIRVSAKGFQTLVTQHYVQKEITQGVFDLILIPQH